ncbi:MAG: dihydropteroate synthase, partial [Spirochaetaceae bacterium]
MPQPPLIMGIINRTPDSFYAASRSNPDDLDVSDALELISQGADILDIGGESSRPGSEYVAAATEIDRVVPYIRLLRKHSAVPISVDTRKAEVADEAISAGANIINDISALRDDPDLALVAARRKVPVVLMHMAGSPRTMQNDPHYSDVVSEVEDFLLAAAQRALDAGISHENIILDPGIGFGKTMEHNIALVQALPRLRQHGFRILLGISRKLVLGMIAGSAQKPLPAEERLAANIVANVIAAGLGADIIRVHDVQAVR